MNLKEQEHRKSDEEPVEVTGNSLRRSTRVFRSGFLLFLVPTKSVSRRGLLTLDLVSRVRYAVHGNAYVSDSVKSLLWKMLTRPNIIGRKWSLGTRSLCSFDLVRFHVGEAVSPPCCWSHYQFGLPIIGQSMSLLKAMRDNTAEHWFHARIKKYGPVSKMNIFGTRTVFLHGQAANKFIYTCDGDILANQQPSSIRRLIGERNILELSGDEHRRLRGALVSFLKPDVLKQYVGIMDQEIRKHFEMNWHGKQKISVMPLMKRLTFNVLSSLIIGMEQGPERDILGHRFQQLMEGMLSVPINLPFTRFNRSLNEREKIRAKILEIIHQKRAALDQHDASPQQDLLSTLISLRNDDNSVIFTDDEIVDNAMVVMLAGHDTTSILLTFLTRLLASDPSVCATILQEQEEIAKNKSLGELLTWEDIGRMRYTWRVAMETLRMNPPVFLSFRKVLRDFEYQGYLIPEGWQVVWSPCMTHMDEDIFPGASEFDPTHFEKQAPPYSFMAFGGGSRICPGNEFARIETLVAIHYIVTRFNLKSCDSDMSFSRDPMPSFRNGLEIEIEPKISSKVQ
ncbi:cytochrome P450 716B1-like [Mercurialis annua]|uniref:cytochrome P450 716B1-like n=1 Tax=Mercurialis annua TaxID=3986 RepID=UPI00215FD4F6|nr:cytochrome P450 716B1-like [Mercurialis annua]